MCIYIAGWLRNVRPYSYQILLASVWDRTYVHLKAKIDCSVQKRPTKTVQFQDNIVVLKLLIASNCLNIYRVLVHKKKGYYRIERSVGVCTKYIKLIAIFISGGAQWNNNHNFRHCQSIVLRHCLVFIGNRWIKLKKKVKNTLSPIAIAYKSVFISHNMVKKNLLKNSKQSDWLLLSSLN